MLTASHIPVNIQVNNMAGLGIIDFDSEWGNEVFNMETSFDSYQLAGATETESLMELQTNSPHQLTQDPTMVMPLDSPSHQPEDNIMLEDLPREPFFLSFLNINR